MVGSNSHMRFVVEDCADLGFQIKSEVNKQPSEYDSFTALCHHRLARYHAP